MHRKSPVRLARSVVYLDYERLHRHCVANFGK